MSKIWFITGASRGFGRSWTEAALRRGDNVAATARDIDTLNDLAGFWKRSPRPRPAPSSKRMCSVRSGSPRRRFR